MAERVRHHWLSPQNLEPKAAITHPKVLNLEMALAETFQYFGHVVRKGENLSTQTMIWLFRPKDLNV